MSTNNKLVAIVVGFAVVAAPVFGAMAETAQQSRQFANRTYQPSIRVASTSTWRHRNTARGWDNTCHNLPYMINMYACSAK
jgi:hypothetical protein